MAFIPPLCQIFLSVTDLRTTEQWFREGLGLQAAGGIDVIISNAAIAPTPTMGANCASKVGPEMLLDVLYLEVAHLGVDVGVAYFTCTDTDRVRQADRYGPAFEYMRKNEPWPLNKLVPKVDALTAETVAQRGAFDGAMAPTPACGAAAASVGRPRAEKKGDKS